MHCMFPVCIDERGLRTHEELEGCVLACSAPCSRLRCLVGSRAAHPTGSGGAFARAAISAFLASVLVAEGLLLGLD